MQSKTAYLAAMTEALRPALLVDVARAATAALRAADAAPDETTRAAARSRWAELIRRSAPDEALEALDALGALAETPAGNRTRAHALLDLGRFDAVRAQRADGAPEPTTAADGLLAAREAYVLDRERALTLSATALSAAEHPEVEADLRCLRARWLAEAGDVAGAREEADRLIALCDAHGAHASRLMAELMRLGFAAIGGEGAEDRLERAIATIVEGMPADPRTLGPLPAHLHGLMLRYAGSTRDPKAFVLSVLTVADLACAAQRFETAFSTLVDGAELARRVFGERVARPIDGRYAALAERLGPERIAALHGWRRRRTEMLLRRVGR